jgi:hypothetical protein
MNCSVKNDKAADGVHSTPASVDKTNAVVASHERALLTLLVGHDAQREMFADNVHLSPSELQRLASKTFSHVSVARLSQLLRFVTSSSSLSASSSAAAQTATTSTTTSLALAALARVDGDVLEMLLDHLLAIPPLHEVGFVMFVLRDFTLIIDYSYTKPFSLIIFARSCRTHARRLPKRSRTSRLSTPICWINITTCSSTVTAMYANNVCFCSVCLFSCVSTTFANRSAATRSAHCEASCRALGRRRRCDSIAKLRAILQRITVCVDSEHIDRGDDDDASQRTRAGEHVITLAVCRRSLCRQSRPFRRTISSFLVLLSKLTVCCLHRLQSWTHCCCCHRDFERCTQQSV